MGQLPDGAGYGKLAGPVTKVRKISTPSPNFVTTDVQAENEDKDYNHGRVDARRNEDRPDRSINALSR